MKRIFVASSIVVLLLAAKGFTAEPDDFDQAVAPYLQKHCLRCHDEKKHEGEFRVDTLSRDYVDLSAAQRWAELITRINAGEMPPAEEPQPTAEESGKVVAWISAQLDKGEAARMAKRGPVAHYRLSREEYANTVYDLLGVHYDVNLPGAFNEDPRWHGFERIGSMLSLSPSHVDRYFNAAEVVLERAFPVKPATSTLAKRDAHASHQKQFEAEGIEGRVRWMVWPQHSIGGVGGIKESGNYRVRIQLSGLQPPGGRAPHLSIWHGGSQRTLYDEDIIAAENQPVVVEFEVQLSPGDGLTIKNDVPGPPNEGHTISQNRKSVFISTKDTRFMQPTGRKLTDDAGFAIYPLLLVDWVEWEGPIITEADENKRKGLFPADGNDLAEARSALKKFADRAWRRPATEAEVDRYVAVLEQELAAGEKFRSAYMAALTGMLTSKNFYYIEEGSADQKRDQVNDWELASRLSYFLWGSMPDEKLFELAEAGKLREPEVLRAELTRMLADAKIKRFTDAYPHQWLQLHKVGMFPPDAKLYPDYDQWLERSMVLETIHYFREMFDKNLPLRHFLSSDWTMVNPRLATHYEMPALKSSGFQRIALRPEDHRGGLLTQASILSLTSDGTRHRPVHRGVWVSEAIFGKTPPPPPPNVEPLETTPVNKEKATIRMQLESHATNANCASCHKRIDPLGFAFDNYDAIGRWRTEENVPRGKGKNPEVNASGSLADGRSFAGPEAFKELLVEDVDQFAEAFIENLATFALRRVMTTDDSAEIKQITQASKEQDYKLQAVIENLVMSDLFQRR